MEHIMNICRGSGAEGVLPQGREGIFDADDLERMRRE